MPDLLITGLGVCSAAGLGVDAFAQALWDGRGRFGVLAREGRQWPASTSAGAAAPPFLGAEIGALPQPQGRRAPRHASWSAQVALATLREAWDDAALGDCPPERIGLVVGGSNFQQRELMLMQARHAAEPDFLTPAYGLGFMDTDLVALCTEAVGLHGPAFTVGGASASGQVATLQAMDLVRSGRVDVCIALGALMDVSRWELQALRAMGAMGSQRFANEPQRACRPFDVQHDGFIFGENCAAVVIERAATAVRRPIRPWARCAAGVMRLDANRQPNPSLEGETAVICAALAEAGWQAAQVDYVNPHGTASTLGDATELQALRDVGLVDVPLNATKAIAGHGLSAAGSVELVATLLQMRSARLHPTPNLDEPIDRDRAWVGARAQAWTIRRALKLSFGFGGVNTALCLQAC